MARWYDLNTGDKVLVLDSHNDRLELVQFYRNETRNSDLAEQIEKDSSRVRHYILARNIYETFDHTLKTSPTKYRIQPSTAEKNYRMMQYLHAFLDERGKLPPLRNLYDGHLGELCVAVVGFSKLR